MHPSTLCAWKDLYGLHEAADLWRARNPSRINQPTTAIYGTTLLRRTSPRNPHSRGGTTIIDLVAAETEDGRSNDQKPFGNESFNWLEVPLPDGRPPVDFLVGRFLPAARSRQVFPKPQALLALKRLEGLPTAVLASRPTTPCCQLRTAGRVCARRRTITMAHGSKADLPISFYMKSSLFCWSIFAALLTTTVASFGQTLTVTDGLVLWLRADAGVTTNENGLVMQWDDQSGSLNHASQSTELQMPLFVPNAITNKPALRFDGSATAGEHDFLNIPHAETLAITGDLTTLFVIKVDDFANYNAVWSKTAGNLPAPTDLYTDINSGPMRLYRGNGTAQNLSTVPSAQPIRAGAYLVLGVDINGTTATHYLNGQLNGTGTVNLNTADTGQDMKIGTRNDFVTRMHGDIAEILIYNRSLSEAERNTAFSYLQNKYGLQNSPPSVTLSATPTGSVNAGTVVTLNATAVDLDGSIARVEFLANGVAIGTALAPPY